MDRSASRAVTYQLVAESEAVTALSAQVSRETGLPAAHIEKDFWITEVLRGVVATAAAANVEVLFKGGTSLSKAFGLIRRFSEDVDVLVIFPPSGQGTRDTLLKRLVPPTRRCSHRSPFPKRQVRTKSAGRASTTGTKALMELG